MNRRKFFASLAGIPFIGAAIAKIASEPASPQELAKAIADRMMIGGIDPSYDRDCTVFVTSEFEPVGKEPWFRPTTMRWQLWNEKTQRYELIG